MQQQYVTRTMLTVRVRCFKTTGIGPEGMPSVECLVDEEVVVTRMNDQVARDVIRAAGVDPRGKQVIWEALHSDTYGMTVEDFFANARIVDRAINGAVTVA
jgi:hypothetical protein